MRRQRADQPGRTVAIHRRRPQDRRHRERAGESNTARATAILVRNGMGVGLCLYSTVREDLDAGRLVRLLQPFEAYDRSVYAVYPHSRHLSGKVRAFIDHLLDTFSG